MTTDVPGLRASRVGSRRFERYLAAIIAGFGLLYALQTLDAFAADWRTMADPVGGVAVGLIGGSVLLGTIAPLAPARARTLFLGASILFCAAVAVWPLGLRGAVPGTPMPWFTALLPVAAAYLAVAFRRPVAPVACALLLSGGIAVVLVVRGGQSVADAIANGLFGVAVSLVLVVLIATVRRGVARADAAQHAALRRYGRSRLDDATEHERARTDVLVHDSVLTTFLSAAAARDPEAEGLARRMASNALRVLDHVNRASAVGPAVPLGKALGDAADRFSPLLADYDLHLGALTDLVLPVEAAEAVVESLLQLMESGLVGAPGATARSVRMSELGPDGLSVLVTDDGADLDPDGARARALQDVVSRMRSVDGRAVALPRQGGGTVVRLSWGSAVVSGVTPRPDTAREVPA